MLIRALRLRSAPVQNNISLTFSLDEKETKNQAKNIARAPHRKLRFLRPLAHKLTRAKILFSSFTAPRLLFLAGLRTAITLGSSRNLRVIKDFFATGVKPRRDIRELKKQNNRGVKNPQSRARDAKGLAPAAAGEATRNLAARRPQRSGARSSPARRGRPNITIE